MKLWKPPLMTNKESLEETYPALYTCNLQMVPGRTADLGDGTVGTVWLAVPYPECIVLVYLSGGRDLLLY